MKNPVKNLALRSWHLTLLILALTWAQNGANAQGASNAAVASGGGSSATATVAANSSVPPLVRFSGVAKESDGAPLSGTVGVTFLIYKDQQGGAPLWLETQNVQPDSTGQYSVMLGATKADGLPTYLFASGEARWLAVQIAGQPEQPRVLLLSVPYAMKAADADTVGGLPASAFLLAAPNAPASQGPISATQTSAAAGGVTADATPTGSGTTGFLPLWTTPSNLGNSGIFQSPTGLIGINTTTPAVNLDVAGNMYIRGGFTMFPENTATATTGYTSHSYYFSASAYNSAKASAENQSFQWQAVPEGNNTATPSGFLNLRFAEGTASSVSTGFGIASNGIVSFAPKQTFPGVPELSAANTFIGNQSITGTVAATSSSGNGVVGSSASTGGVGVEGNATASSGYTSGVSGTTSSP
ncbi:MAG TPA: hypothetical protein VKF79_05310, partial [Candidatus Acidoferrum sp.]|nr:hypothetical protein [Candidatus Acidoferrum sp.]